MRVGPWIQIPDYPSEAFITPLSPPRWRRVAGESFYNVYDAPWGADGDEYPYELPWSPIELRPSATWTQLSVDPTTGVVGPSQYLPVIQQVDFPQILLEPPIPYAIDPALWPEGAVGYEWEAEAGQIIQQDATMHAYCGLADYGGDFSRDLPIRLMYSLGWVDVSDERAFPTGEDLRVGRPTPEPEPGFPPPPQRSWTAAEPLATPWPFPAWQERRQISWPIPPTHDQINEEAPPAPVTISVLAVPDFVLTGETPPLGVQVGMSVTLSVSRVMRYPRHRFIFADLGMRRLRQRQTLTGADSWPLRQRQNGAHSGSWSLRQRQRGV